MGNHQPRVIRSPPAQRVPVAASSRQTLHGRPGLLARLALAPLEVAAELQIPTAPPEEELGLGR